MESEQKHSRATKIILAVVIIVIALFVINFILLLLVMGEARPISAVDTRRISATISLISNCV